MAREGWASLVRSRWAPRVFSQYEAANSVAVVQVEGDPLWYRRHGAGIEHSNIYHDLTPLATTDLEEAQITVEVLLRMERGA